jgi:O-antigen ligase
MTSAAVAVHLPEAAAVRHSQPQVQSAVFFGVVGLFLFGPLAFGAVEPWAILVLEAGSAMLFATWAIWGVAQSEIELTWSPLFLPMVAFAAVIALQCAFRQTTYWATTFSAVLLYGSYGLLCFLLVQTLRRTWQIRFVAIALSAYGFALALFGLLQGIAANGKLYWIRAPRFGGWIYGPYVNHNHYAGLMEMLAPIPLIIFLSPRTRREFKMMAGFAAAFMASTIFLCGSRGGMFAFAVELVILFAIRFKLGETQGAGVKIGAVVAMAIALLVGLGNQELVGRMISIPAEAHTELSGGTRLSIDRDCLRMLAAKPILGWGLGNFSTVYPQFRTFYTNFLIDHAHNDYLELLTETGIAGFAVLTWFLVSVYRAGLKKIRTWPGDLNAQIAMAALVGISGILVHSSVDFNLHIPANMALFLGLCVTAASESHFGHHSHHPHRQHKTSPIEE